METPATTEASTVTGLFVLLKALSDKEVVSYCLAKAAQEQGCSVCAATEVGPCKLLAAVVATVQLLLPSLKRPQVMLP